MTTKIAYRVWKHSPMIVRFGMVGVGAYVMQRRVRRRLHEIF